MRVRGGAKAETAVLKIDNIVVWYNLRRSTGWAPHQVPVIVRRKLILCWHFCVRYLIWQAQVYLRNSEWKQWLLISNNLITSDAGNVQIVRYHIWIMLRPYIYWSKQVKCWIVFEFLFFLKLFNSISNCYEVCYL